MTVNRLKKLIKNKIDQEDFDECVNRMCVCVCV